MKKLKKIKILANVTTQFNQDDTETGVEWVNSYQITKRNKGKILRKEKENNYNYLQDEDRIYSAILLPNENCNFSKDDFKKYNIFSPTTLKIGNKIYAIDLSSWN